MGVRHACIVLFVSFVKMVSRPECLNDRAKKMLKYPYGVCTCGYLTRLHRQISNFELDRVELHI